MRCFIRTVDPFQLLSFERTITGMDLQCV